MHDQCFPVILDQLIDFSVIGNIALRLIEQQNIFYPATDVVLGEKKTVIFWQTGGEHGLKVFFVQKVSIDLYQKSLSFVVMLVGTRRTEKERD